MEMRQKKEEIGNHLTMNKVVKTRSQARLEDMPNSKVAQTQR